MAREYPPEIRAQVLADLALGMSISAAARKYKLSKDTVIRWRDEALADGTMPTVIDHPIERDPRTGSNDLQELIGAFVVASVRSLRVQVELMGDKAWLARLEPSEVLSVHRELRDGTIRILATAERGKLPVPGPEGGGGPGHELP